MENRQQSGGLGPEIRPLSVPGKSDKTEGKVAGCTRKVDDTVRDTSVRPERPVLGEVNDLFHDLYTARERRVVEQLESGAIPSVIRMDDRLILLAGGEAEEYVITGERYHELKAASHIPAAALLALSEPSAEYATRLGDLDAFADKIGEGAGAIISATRALFEQARTSTGNLDLLLADYAVAARSALQELACAAASEEIEALDDAMREIETKFDRKRLDAAYFVICGGHQPRYKELSKMYFKYWLIDAGWSQPLVAHRVVYAEGKDSLDEALELVRKRVVDGWISTVLFGDLVSLDEDVLGDAGIRQLERRFKPSR